MKGTLSVHEKDLMLKFKSIETKCSQDSTRKIKVTLFLKRPLLTIIIISIIELKYQNAIKV